MSEPTVVESRKGTQSGPLISLLTVLLAITALGIRILGARQTFWSIPGAAFAALIGATATLISGCAVLARVLRSEVPLTRLLLPALVFVELLRIGLGSGSRTGLIAVVGLFELAVVAVAVLTVARSESLQARQEDRIEGMLRLFMPDKVAGLTSVELVLLWQGMRFLSRGFRSRSVPGFGYIEQSPVALLPILIPLLTLGDEVALGILLRQQSFWLRLTVVAVDLWAILWSFGIYVTMKERPHRVSDTYVQLNRGIFACCEFSPSLVKAVTPLAEAPTLPRGTPKLTIKGSPVLEIRFVSPVVVQRPGARDRKVDTVLVSADDPTAFATALTQALGRAQGETIAAGTALTIQNI